jgi:hypothetical protein
MKANPEEKTTGPGRNAPRRRTGVEKYKKYE